jgi:hypothetical protein
MILHLIINHWSPFAYCQSLMFNHWSLFVYLKASLDLQSPIIDDPSPNHQSLITICLLSISFALCPITDYTSPVSNHWIQSPITDIQFNNLLPLIINPWWHLQCLVTNCSRLIPILKQVSKVSLALLCPHLTILISQMLSSCQFILNNILRIWSVSVCQFLLLLSSVDKWTKIFSSLSLFVTFVTLPSLSVSEAIT